MKKKYLVSMNKKQLDLSFSVLKRHYDYLVLRYNFLSICGEGYEHIKKDIDMEMLQVSKILDLLRGSKNEC